MRVLMTYLIMQFLHQNYDYIKFENMTEDIY